MGKIWKLALSTSDAATRLLRGHDNLAMNLFIFVALAVLCETLHAFQAGTKGLVSRQIGQLQVRGREASHSSRLDMMFGFGGSSSSKINIPKGKKLAVVTGTTSGLGKETARSLIDSGDYFVVCAVRDTEKMAGVASDMGFDESCYNIMELDLGSYASTKNFAKKLQASKSKGLDALVCNAAVYQPALPTVCDGSKISMHHQLPPAHFIFFLLFPFLLSPSAKVHSGWPRGTVAD